MHSIAVLPGGGYVVADAVGVGVWAVAPTTGAATLLRGAANRFPSAVATDMLGRIVVADYGPGAFSELRVVDPTSGSTRVLELVDSHGMPASLGIDVEGLAIDGQGDIWCTNAEGVHRVTGTGLAPGFHAWTRVTWRPSRAIHHHQLPRWARAAVRTVLLIATRTHLRRWGFGHAGSYRSSAAAGARTVVRRSARSQRGVFELPVLPTEIWQLVLMAVDAGGLGSHGAAVARFADLGRLAELAEAEAEAAAVKAEAVAAAATEAVASAAAAAAAAAAILAVVRGASIDARARAGGAAFDDSGSKLNDQPNGSPVAKRRITCASDGGIGGIGGVGEAKWDAGTAVRDADGLVGEPERRLHRQRGAGADASPPGAPALAQVGGARHRSRRRYAPIDPDDLYGLAHEAVAEEPLLAAAEWH
jgi:hypothetical protein